MSTISVPDELYRKAMDLAKAQQVSVDDVFASAFTEQLSVWNRLKARASRGNRDQFLAVLDTVPDVEPEELDRIEDR
jgi:hypothetical protein